MKAFRKEKRWLKAILYILLLIINQNKINKYKNEYDFDGKYVFLKINISVLIVGLMFMCNYEWDHKQMIKKNKYHSYQRWFRNLSKKSVS